MTVAIRAFFRSVAVILTLALLSACVPGFPSEKAPMKPVDLTDGQIVEPGNRVRLIVFGEQALSGDFTIDASGVMSLPLIGNIPASGLTSPQLSERISAQLQKAGYMRDPKVVVEIQTFRPFYVLGEVRQPGEYQFSHGMTVLSAIARAGGYDYRAWEGEVTLVRVVNGEQKEYHAVERTPIMPGDIIRVAQRRF